MGRILSWAILIGVFLLSGFGLNLVRVAIVDKLANPAEPAGLRVLIGLLLMAGGVYFLGGYIYYRLKKKGKLKKPDWIS